MANITFLPTQGTINLAGEKVIALNQANIDLLKRGYSTDPMIANTNNAVSNKDLLAQSFAPIEPLTISSEPIAPNQSSGEPTLNQIETTPIENVQNSIPPVEEKPIQLTSIPTFQSTNLESNPATLSMEPIEGQTSNPIDLSITGSLDPLQDLQGIIPNTSLNVTPLEDLNISAPVETNPNAPENVVLSTNQPEELKNEIKDNSDVFSPFQISSAPNIFDQPIISNNVETPTFDNNEPSFIFVMNKSNILVGALKIRGSIHL